MSENRKNGSNYVEAIGNFLSSENIEKKLTWIGMSQSKGDSATQNTLRKLIVGILERDPLGLERYLTHRTTHFVPASENNNISLSKEKLKAAKEGINLVI